MSKDEIIKMAKEALVVPFFLKETNDEAMIRLRDFAALVAAAVYENEDMFTEAYAGGFAAGAAAEREACAQMVDHILKEGGGTYGDAIRARVRK
jgi:hypothetical protein